MARIFFYSPLVAGLLTWGGTSNQSVVRTVVVLSFCQDICDSDSDGIEIVEVTIQVLSLDLTTMPVTSSNFFREDIRVDNDVFGGDNRSFDNIRVPETGNYTITFNAVQSCSDCCMNHSDRSDTALACNVSRPLGGEPTWTGTSVRVMAETVPLSVNSSPEFSGCRFCGCED